jgi:hypothetical protein
MYIPKSQKIGVSMTKKKTVRKGQIWLDADRRREKRSLRILHIHQSHVLVENIKTGRETVIAESRLKPTTRGYKLFRNPAKKK